MQFDSLVEFFAMGGHGLYVWLAYGATVVVLVGSVWSVRMSAKGQWLRLKLNTYETKHDQGGNDEPQT